MKIETKFNIGDIAYSMCSYNDCKKIEIYAILIFKEKIFYECHIIGKDYIYSWQIDEENIFKTQEECERNYVLKKFNHLFKDSKTLK